MKTVRGLLGDRERALRAVEALRAAGFDHRGVQLVGSPAGAAEVARETGSEQPGAAAGAGVGALVGGPVGAVVGGLLGGVLGRDLSSEQAREHEARVAEGAVLVTVAAPDGEAAERALEILRQAGAEHASSG